jgi:hypothetical protein
MNSDRLLDCDESRHLPTFCKPSLARGLIFGKPLSPLARVGLVFSVVPFATLFILALSLPKILVLYQSPLPRLNRSQAYPPATPGTAKQSR